MVLSTDPALEDDGDAARIFVTYGKLAESLDVPVYKFRGDEVRDFVQTEMNTNSFPTINYIKSDGTAVKYESEERTVDAMTAFAKGSK